jgi:hypothetical protein
MIDGHGGVRKKFNIAIVQELLDGVQSIFITQEFATSSTSFTKNWITGWWCILKQILILRNFLKNQTHDRNLMLIVVANSLVWSS